MIGDECRAGFMESEARKPPCPIAIFSKGLSESCCQKNHE